MTPSNNSFWACIEKEIGRGICLQKQHGISEICREPSSLLKPALFVWFGTCFKYFDPAVNLSLFAPISHSNFITISTGLIFILVAICPTAAKLHMRATLPFLLGMGLAPGSIVFADLSQGPQEINATVISAPRRIRIRQHQPGMRSEVIALVGNLNNQGLQIPGQIWLTWPASSESFGRGDQLKALISAGTGSHRRILSPEQLVRKPGHRLLAQFDIWRQSLIDHLWPHDDGWGCALLLGERRLLSPETRTHFKKTGLAHLLAISGLHIGLLLQILTRCGHRCSPHIGRIFRGSALFLVCLQVFMSGADAPAIRAAVSGVFFHLALNAGRNISLRQIWALNLLAWCLMGHAPPHPSATISLAAVMALQMAAVTHFDKPKKSILFSGFLASLGAHAALVWWTPFFSPWSALFTLLMLPVIALTWLTTQWTLLTGSDPTSFHCQMLWNLCIFLLEKIPEIFLKLPGTPLILTALGPLTWTFLFISSVMLLTRRHQIAQLLLLLASLSTLLQSLPQEGLTLSLLSRGRGQAFLLTDRKDALLFDAGDTSAHDGGTQFIRRQLWKLNQKRLRGLFISHPHLDHQSAVPGLIAAKALDRIYLADSYRSQPQGQSLIHLANKYSVPLKWITDGNRFRIGSFEVFVISAEQPPIGGIQINDMSPLILIRWKETYILTSGDAQSGVLSASLITGPIDHVLIPHHGSPAPNLKSWLTRLQARTFWVARKKPLPPETALFLQSQDLNHVKFHGDNINVLTIQQQFEDTQDPRQIPRQKHELTLMLHRFQNFRFRLEQKIGESPT